jgi:hypothetical protein
VTVPLTVRIHNHSYITPPTLRVGVQGEGRGLYLQSKGPNSPPFRP